ncbi:MAG: hypothetical protein JSS87_06340 [Acidobacteria bacterium]|nr:hypothetical protein [Acidobacteriota bacterium]
MRNLMGRRSFAGIVGAALLLVASSALTAGAQTVKNGVFVPPPVATYTEKFEIYGGLLFMNGQAGQNLPKRYNMGGGEGMFTWYVTPKWGVAGDFRWAGGTTPVNPGAQVYDIQTRPFVSQTIGMGGVQYRLAHNKHAALQLHALAGVTNGNFSHSTHGLDPLVTTGMYRNGSAPMGVVGGSIDLNRSARWAVRLSPEMIFEHFGTETREFISISGGVLYRFGKR